MNTTRCFYVSTPNTFTISDNNYTTFKAIFSALKNREVQGILMDTYQTGSEKNTIKDPLLHIEKIYDDKSTYGIVIAGNSTKLLSCSKGYMQANKAAMSQHISGFIDVVEVSKITDTYQEYL